MDEKKSMAKENEKERAAYMSVLEDEAEEEESLVVKLKKPCRFEGKEYTELDLSGMEDMTGADMIAVNKLMERAGVRAGSTSELTLEYACYFASRAAKLPVELFMGLHPNDAVRVKNCVIGFLFG